MTEREKLIELLRSNQNVLQAAGTSATATLRLADHLIANGATIPVRCKDCTEFYKGKCENVLGLPNPYPDGFCPFGERKLE